MNQVSSRDQRILYIGTRSQWINIDDELEVIKTFMDAPSSKFEVDTEIVRSVRQISDAIQNKSTPPEIIHISGEGKADGKIVIVDPENNKVDPDNNKGEPLKPDTLVAFLKNAGDVNCVVLNFCYSIHAANLIAQHIPNVKCVIGINGEIGSIAAVDFSRAFYRYLQGKTLNQSVIDAAFSRGQAAASQRTGDIDTYIKLPLPEPEPEKPEPEMEMIEPAEGSNIPRNCKFSGTFKNLDLFDSDSDCSIWVYYNDTRKYHLFPINDYHSDGTWQKVATIGQENDPNPLYRVGVLIAYTEDTKTLKENFSKSGYLCLDKLPEEDSDHFSDRAVTRQ